MNFAKNLLIFLVGGAAGALLTYRMLEKRYEERENDLTAQVEAEFEELEKMREEFYTDTKYQEPELGYDDEGNLVEVNYNNVITKEEGEKLKKMTKRYTEYNKISTSDMLKDVNLKIPYVISEDQYHNELLYFDKVLLYYYEQDDVLTDENEEIITNGYELIGDDTLSNFGESCEDPDVVYIRNESLSKDYEIIRLDKSYQETVLGFTEEARKRRKAKNSEKQDLGDE